MEIKKFKEKYPIHGECVNFSKLQIDDLMGYIPQSAVDFLKEYGRCSFGGGILQTIYPDDIDSKEIFKEWGLKKYDYKVFMKNCFGVLIFSDKKSFYYLDPLQGNYQKIDDDLEFILDGFFLSDVYAENIFHYADFLNRKKELVEVSIDEVYMLVPTLQLGGSFETSKFEPGKLVEHLSFLAQLKNNKAKKLQ